MGRLWVISLLFVSFAVCANAATPVQRRATVERGAPASQATGRTRSVRSVARSATPAPVAARVAVRAPVAAKPAPSASKAPSVVARSATKKVIGTGTNIAVANKNTVVSEKCRNKYNGCLDSFCMLDNATGGRCLCSDRKADLDAIAAQIDELDAKSYQMATTGVAQIEMNEEELEGVREKMNSVTESLENGGNKENNRQKAREPLDLSLWDNEVDFTGEEEIFGSDEDFESEVSGKTGDSLYAAASRVCISRMPECKEETKLLRMMYVQQVQSDCMAYENALKQKKNASAQKLAAAEKAMRESALDKFRTENRYDLGQCVTEFKNCMMTTADCGDDFSNCATVVALKHTSDKSNKTPMTYGKKTSGMYSIKGASSTIEISTSTYDTLVAKKPLCDHVTKYCVKYANQVWDTFLKEAAPQLKSAELIAEEKIRQGCIGSISDCFQKGCKDTMDPDDPDGSYDACLMNNDMILNVCKIQLENCGVDTSSPDSVESNPIWNFVKARLVSMTDNTCIREFKECLTSDLKCGKDYSQCVGLDEDTITDMCPQTEMLACQRYDNKNKNDNGETAFEHLIQTVAKGIFLGIDNKLLSQCQNAANEAMVKVCGDTEDCNGLIVDKDLFARTLTYKVCDGDGKGSDCYDYAISIPNDKLEDGTKNRYKGIITGQINWRLVDYSLDNKTDAESKPIPVNNVKIEYNGGAPTALAALKNDIDRMISIITLDPKVKACREGKKRIAGKDNSGTSSFPNLVDSMIMTIADKAISEARKGYEEKYEELVKRGADDAVTIAKKISENKAESEAQKAAAALDANEKKCQSYGTGDDKSKLKADYWEKNVSSTFDRSTGVCTVTTKKRTCDKNKVRNKLLSQEKRYCASWNDWVETKQTYSLSD